MRRLADLTTGACVGAAATLVANSFATTEPPAEVGLPLTEMGLVALLFGVAVVTLEVRARTGERA